MFSRRPALLIVSLLAAGWGGYRVGLSPAFRKPEMTPGIAPDSKAFVRPLEGAESPPRVPLAELVRLADSGKLSKLEVWEQLERCSAAEIKAELLPLLTGVVKFGAVIHTRELLLFRWGQLEPREAMEFAKSFTPEELLADQYIATVFTAWWTRDPEAACHWAVNSTVFNQPGSGPAWVYAILRKEEPGAAVRRAAELGPEILNYTAIRLMDSWNAAAEGQDFMSFIRDLDSPACEAAAVRAIRLQELKPDDEESSGPHTWQAALQKLGEMNLPVAEAEDLRDSMALDWAFTYPVEILKWSVSQEGVNGSRLQQQCMRYWEADEEKEELAPEWLKSQANPGSLYAVSASLRVRMMVLDRMFHRTEDVEQAERDLNRLLDDWGQVDPDGVARWKESSDAERLDLAGGYQLSFD
jgi:hypothetical protein